MIDVVSLPPCAEAITIGALHALSLKGRILAAAVVWIAGRIVGIAVAVGSGVTVGVGVGHVVDVNVGVEV